MKRRIRATRVLFVAALTAPALLLGAQAAEASWTIETVPSPAGVTNSTLFDVSCPAATACLAVGAGQSDTPIYPAFSEDWNGTKWVVKSVRDARIGQLLSVSCTSASACTAVGAISSGPQGQREVRALAERWNGTTWTVQSVPGPGVSLESVSCPTTTTCVAVGNRGLEVFAYLWKGGRWTASPPDAAGQLYSISCTSATSCVAVGSQNPPSGYPVSVTWNGTSWTRQPVSLPSGSQGNFYWVSCGSPDACQAVGYYIDASGGVDPLAETWNGADWSADVIAPLGSGVAGGFDSVSCARSGPCTAVGFQETGPGGPDGPLDEYWNGTGWTAHSIPEPTGSTDEDLMGVSCATGTECTVVGEYYTGAGRLPLAEQGS
jgi:hypothetical protein